RKQQKAQPQPVISQPIKASKRKIRVADAIRVADMAHQMGVKASEIIKALVNLGVMATINQSLDIDTATLIAGDFGYEIENVGFSEADYLTPKEADAPESLKPRPPVVTIMGHVDHGKTSLLDAIRKSNVTSGEAGGITQHIGAYHVKTKRGEIVFLDTPGHEAFTAMRARGAQITDLVILVVAADDGVMDQTREAINHSRAANVPIMVAVNKMDKPGADPDRVLRELSELGLQPEDWGGDTIVAKVSAKTREGLDELLELVALQSEIMDLKANPDKPARGHIVEARLDKGRGPIATVLVQEGVLRPGDNFVCGTFAGRVRAMNNDQGKKVKEAGPSMPVEVLGFEGVPVAGEEFQVVADEKMARKIADYRSKIEREKTLAASTRVTLENFLTKLGDQDILTLNLVLKADVQGSLEAISEALKKENTDKVKINVVHGGTGAISETDIMLASASKAIVIGFNVRPAARIKDIAEKENVDVRYYDIIYKLVDDVKSAMAGLLAPVQKEVDLGQAEVRKVYHLPKIGAVAGSYVLEGKMVRNANARLLRDGIVIYTGKIASLKRFKDDAREVVKGNECGIGLENYNDIKEGDILEAYETVEEAATL
ncbi:MAG: translation initiation factor IF-2, partial [Desulfovibrio sp.]|nr:translation initiation factor IF-2 [Desulfovibrio sp.]